MSPCLVCGRPAGFAAYFCSQECAGAELGAAPLYRLGESEPGDFDSVAPGLSFRELLAAAGLPRGQSMPTVAGPTLHRVR